MTDMTSMLRRHGLPAPFVPPPLRDQISTQRDWVWGTCPDVPRLYEVDDYVEALTTGTPEDFFLLGHDGYGTNSWFLHCYVSWGPVSVLIQTSWGGAYANARRAVETVRRQFELMERLLLTGEKAVLEGRALPGRLVVRQTEIAESGWAWVQTGQPVTWHTDAGDDALRSALEALLALP